MRPIPDWLAPRKNHQVSLGKLCELLALNGEQSFRQWFLTVKDRAHCTESPQRNGNGVVRHYLVKHVWAMACAHGLELVKPEFPTAEARRSWEAERECQRLRAQVRDLTETMRSIRAQAPPVATVDLKTLACWITDLLMNATDPKPMPGVYFLLSVSGKVMYIGQSGNVLSRMSGHSGKDFLLVRMIHVADQTERLKLEARLIDLLDPPLNANGISMQEKAARVRQRTMEAAS